MLEIYAGFDSPKVFQVALTGALLRKDTNYTSKTAKKKKRETPKSVFALAFDVIGKLIGVSQRKINFLRLLKKFFFERFGFQSAKPEFFAVAENFDD